MVDKPEITQFFPIVQNGGYSGTTPGVGKDRIREETSIRNYLSISLVISSKTMPPESISDRVGLTPTETRLRGTPTKTGIFRLPECDLHEWWIRSELEFASGERVEDLQP